MFTANAYRATRLVVMPEWQGAGAGTRFLNYVAQYHLEGRGRCGREYPTFFHTSHPQLCAYLRNAPGWRQTGAKLHGDNKARSMASMARTSKGMDGRGKVMNTGYGGHFRAVQAFKFEGIEAP